jgi:hypothetical protein
MVKGMGMTATFLNKTCILSIFIITVTISCSKQEDSVIQEPGAAQRFTEILSPLIQLIKSLIQIL